MIQRIISPLKTKINFLTNSKNLVIGYLALFLLSTLSTYFILGYLNKGKEKVTPTEVSYDEWGTEAAEEDGSYNVLLLGYGGAGHDGGGLSDSLLVAHIKPSEKKIFLISVPRDTWVELPVRSDLKEYHKINEAFAIGNSDTLYPLKEPEFKGEGAGGKMAKLAVSQVVGMDIDYFAAVDFGSFIRAVDALGGIEVAVPVTFDDYFYPIKGLENETCGKSAEEIAKLHELYTDTALHHQFECRYEHIHFDKGKVQMDGETALKFVRSRASTQHGGDFARSQRQIALLLGVKDKILSIGFLAKPGEFFSNFVGMVSTDIDEEIVRELVKTLPKPNEFEVFSINLTEDNVFVSSRAGSGAFILIPKDGRGNWEGVSSFIQERISASDSN